MKSTAQIIEFPRGETDPWATTIQCNTELTQPADSSGLIRGLLCAFPLGALFWAGVYALFVLAGAL